MLMQMLRTFWSEGMELWRRHHGWIISAVLLPFVLTRAALLLSAWFAHYFTPYPYSEYTQEVLDRGWIYFGEWWLDVWIRWDSHWYVDIIMNGYRALGDLTTKKSNLAFYPLYPYLVKGLSLFIPKGYQLRRFIEMGLLLSNVSFLAGLVLLYRIALDLTRDDGVAQRTVLYILIFPASFYFSCFYTESLFLFLSVVTIWLAMRHRWALASAYGALAALTRMQGLLLLAPLAILYLDAIDWSPRRLRLDIAWLALPLLAFAGYLLALYPITGDLLAPFHVVQGAWGRAFGWPWDAIFNPTIRLPYMSNVDTAMAFLFLTAVVAAFFMFRSKSYAVYAATSTLLPLSSTFLWSVVRYYATIFPVFIVLALWGRRPWVDKTIQVIFFTLLILLVAAWTRFYWVA